MRVAAFLGASLPLALGAAGPVFEVSPADALIDTLPALQGRGFAPFERLTVTARERGDDGAEWKSEAIYYADSQGAFDAAASPSVAGSYQGVDAEGLLWSMQPAGAGSARAWLDRLATEPSLPRRPVRARLGTREIEFSLRRDPPGGAPITARLMLRRIAPGVAAREVSAGQVRGVWFEPPADVARKRTVVVVIDGSFGGLRENVPALLASRGWPAFALGYFKYKDRPDVANLLPLEYFQAGLAWARSQPGVERVVLWGYSRGAEAALLTASHFPRDLDAVIAVSPSHVVNNGEGKAWGDWITERDSMWSFAGRGVPCAPYAELGATPWATRREKALSGLPGYGISAEYRELWLRPGVARTYGIPVERFTGRMLLAAGTADEIWPSALAVTKLAETSGPRATVSLQAGVGHAVLTPGEVTTFGHVFFVDDRIRGYVQVGGSPAANAAGARRAWADTRAFLESLEGTHVR